MARAYNRYERVREHMIRYKLTYGKYPESDEVARVFRIGLRAAQKFMRQYFRELGE